MLSSRHFEVPNDGEGLFFLNQIPEAHRPGSTERKFWGEWIPQFCGIGTSCSEHEQCWGNTIIRTSYDDDDKFSRAVAAIRRLALIPIQYDFETRGTDSPRSQAAEEDEPEVDEDISLDITTRDPGLTKSLQEIYPRMVRRARANLPEGVRCTHDWVITHELVCRYHDVVADDKAALDGADISAAWEYFLDNYESRVSGLRGDFFVLLDEESIELLSAAPGEQQLAAMTPQERAGVSWRHWVKAVADACKVTDEGEEIEEEISDDAMGRRRIRLFDYLSVYLDMQHCHFSEIGVEGDDRERFPGYNSEDEWQFCKPYDEEPVTWPWMEELYGIKTYPWQATSAPSGSAPVEDL